MATFTEIYYNGNEYKQMWLNGSKVWERDSSKIIYPYPDADCVITFSKPSYNTESLFTFDIIDNTLPYCVWITDQPYNKPTTNTKTQMLGTYRGSQISFENLKPTTNSTTYHPLTIEQLRLPNLTDLSYLFRNFCYDNSKTYSWQPQYFEFHPNPTNMYDMFYHCFNLTDEMMAQFMPYFPNTSKVTSMSDMFNNCQSLTTLDLSSFNTSKVTSMYQMFYDNYNLANLNVSSFDTTNVTDMGYMFGGCSSLTSLDLSSFNTSNLRNVRYMFNNCCSLRTLDLSNFDTRNITYYEDYQYMFQYVENCTIYIGENWTLGTESTFGGGSNLTFIRVVPITNITLESTLTDTIITKGTQFTITPTITPTDYSGDELIITYDTNSLSMVDNTFTVLDTATIGQQLDITYSSKNNPSVSATYSVSIRDSISITSIVLTHTLESLTDVAIGTTFTVVPTVEPLSHDDELLVDYDTNYLSKDGDNYTVLGGASGQTVQVIYYSKHDNNVNAMLEFTVEEKAIIVYPYDDADSVVTYGGGYSSNSITFEVIDSTLPYSINGTSTKSFTFPEGEAKAKLINLKPAKITNQYQMPTKFEQLRIPNLTDLSDLFYCFCYSSDYNYEYSWSPQYFEFNENPTNMNQMFSYCYYLTQNMWDEMSPYFPSTSQVTSMYRMFYCCSSLTSLDLSNFNTGKVTDMREMFYGCKSLTSLDLSNFNTSSVTDMYGVFENCSSLTSLDLSNFDTSKVSNMSNMFRDCNKLTSLDLRSFDTSNVALSTTNYTFYNVKNCTIYINTDKWTLGTSSSLGGGTNLTFVPIVVPIESINGITTDINDTTNVTEQYFTVTPNISPSNYSSDLEVIYDSIYLKSKNNKDFELLEGSNGQTLSITYRSKSNNSISETITFTVSEDFYIKIIDYSRFEEPTLPSWISKYSANCSSEVIYSNTSMIASNNIYVCGLKFTPNSSYKIIQKYCYKVIPPKDGILQFNYREKGHDSTYPFTIHITNSTSVPNVTSTTGRIAYDTGGNYQDIDGIVYSYPTVELKGGETYYVYIQNSSYATKYGLLRRIEFLEPNIDQLALTHNIDDLTNVLQPSFTITPIITPSCYTVNDLDVAYDSTYLSTTDNLKFSLKEGCQGKTLNITYRSKIGNPISDTLTFTVSQDLEIPTVIDFTQSTAPELLSCMTLDGQGSSYYFSHGTYTTNVYGLVPNNNGINSSVAYTRYKFVAPKDGTLTFTYRCSSESKYDYLTVHVDSSTSQPSYDSSTNRLVYDSGTTYASKDGTASVNVTSGTTYYIHIQYRKDSSGNSGYDKGCIRKIELVTN